MSEKKILLLVEGEKIEPELLEHFYGLYEYKNIKIVAYKTNLYAFYHRLLKDYSNSEGNIEYEFIDLPLFLNDYLGLEGAEKIDRADFQDILLIFDYDPQDPSYTRDKLTELLTNFSNSTDIGKLYINYPMVESYKDISSLDDDSFLSSSVDLHEIQRGSNGKNMYKGLVNSRTCVPTISSIDKNIGKKIIDLQNRKLELIVSDTHGMEKKYIKLCEVVCNKLEQESKVWVISTCLIHLFDEYGELK